VWKSGKYTLKYTIRGQNMTVRGHFPKSDKKYVMIYQSSDGIIL